MRPYDRFMTELEEVAPPPARERRRFVRTRVGLPVTITLPEGGSLEHVAINVSAGGLLASPVVASAEGGTCTVQVTGFDAPLEARVISHRASGTGLAFTDTVTGEALALWMVERAIRGG
ncbi:MAG: hypothetical protein DHS20C03_10710 [Minwuia thermotolerans]|nr:MAG: hypothetical protein DHS20C03_10710 [Minwuia thermotolerans]